MSQTRNHNNRRENRTPDRSNNDRQYAKPLATEKVRGDEYGKKFFLDLNENARGVVLRIKEVSENGRTNFIMIPGESIADFSAALDAIAEVYNQR